MKVYKFGGASVRDGDGVRNLVRIVSQGGGRLFVIVSAMGKNTNALEWVVEDFYGENTTGALARLKDIERYHDNIVADLWGKQGEQATLPQLAKLYTELEELIASRNPATRDYEVWYDRIVSYGELFSTTIISEYLNREGVESQWVDMRQVFITSSRHRDANIDIELSTPLLLDVVNSSQATVFVGQGFIGATENGAPTTIGREGSDYSAAVAGYILDAESVSIWKDVDGILNGDPKIFEETTLIPELTYLDAIELAYSGAQIIHPKTIKPLQNKNIPLYVRSFVDPAKAGSVIKGETAQRISIPVLIIKHKQVLMSIRPRDFSFVLEERFAELFNLLSEYHVKVNCIQSSAVNLSICLDANRYLDEIVERLNSEGYRASYNTDMELLTIRGYTAEQLARYADTKDIYLAQRTRRTLRVVRKATKR